MFLWDGIIGAGNMRACFVHHRRDKLGLKKEHIDLTESQYPVASSWISKRMKSHFKNPFQTIINF